MKFSIVIILIKKGMYIFDMKKIIFKQTKIRSFTFDSIISFVQSLKKKDFFSKGRIWNSREDPKNRRNEGKTFVFERNEFEIRGRIQKMETKERY